MEIIQKTPPHAIDVEKSVLGAILVDSKSAPDVMHILNDSAIFYDTQNICVFKAIERIYSENGKIDLITVANQLKLDGNLETAGGHFYLVQLSQLVASGAHVEQHARILVQFYIKRQLIQQCALAMSKAYDSTADSLFLLDMMTSQLNDIAEKSITGKKQITFEKALDQVVNDVERLTNQSGDELTGIPTGFAKVDALTGGWQANNLIIIAARPGMGKTALTMKNVLACVHQNINVGFISLEMSTKQLTTRAVANDSQFHLNQLMRTGFDKPQYFNTLQQVVERMKKYNIFINDTASMDIRDVLAQIRIWKKRNNIEIVFIDYLQLIKDRTKSNNREQEISSIARQLKMIAKEMDIPVVALAQVSRKCEERGGDKKPKLADLRESGAIEQDADVVAMLWRPEYYGIDVPQELMEMNANTELNFVKHRNGSVERKGLYFIENKTKFIDPDVEFHEVENLY